MVGSRVVAKVGNTQKTMPDANTPMSCEPANIPRTMNKPRTITPKLVSSLTAAVAALCLLSSTASAIIVTTTNGSGADVELAGWGDTGAVDSANGTATSMNIRKTTTRNETICLRFDLTGYTRTDYLDYAVQLINQRANSAGATLAFYGVNDNAAAEDNNGTVRGYTDDTWLESPLEFSTMPGMHWTNSSTADQGPNASAVLLGTLPNPPTAEGTTVSFSSAALTSFIQNHADGLVTIIVVRTDAGTGQARFATREASVLASGGSGIPGDYAPRLSFGNPITSVTWTGAVSTEWNNPTNWLVAMVPTNGISALIPASSNVNFNAPAFSFDGLTNGGTLNINTNGFTNAFSWCNVATGIINVNSNGAMGVAGDVSLYSKGALSLAAGGSLNANRLLIGSGSTGGTGSQTGSSYGRATNNGGILIAPGGVQLNPGNGSLSTSTSASDNSPHLEINGGYNNLGAVRIRRAHGGNNAPNPLGRDGLVVKGGVVEMTSLLMDGNTHGTVWISGGAVTNAGTSELKNPTGSRPARFVQTGGLYVGGGVLTLTLLDNYFSVTGGTNVLAGIAFGAASDTGTAKFTNSSSLYVGSSGITHNGVLTVLSQLSPGGLLGAQADWSGAAPLALGTGEFTFRAAALDGTPHNITYSGVLSGTGPLAKTGGGVLTLNAAHTYSEKTLIREGTLALGASGSLASSEITVGSNTVFDVTATSFTLPALKTLSGVGIVTGNVAVASSGIINPGTNGATGTLTFTDSLTQSGGAVTHFDLSTNPSGPNNDLVVIGGDLNVSGLNTLEISGGGAPGSVHPLFKYSGTLNGDLSNFSLVGPSGILTNDTSVTPKVISLVVQATLRAPTNIVWVGNSVQNDWDIQNLTNWLNAGSLDFFRNGDNVTFDANGAANPNINLTALAQPGSVVVNAASDYTISGTGSISGSASLTKTNSGKLTIQNDHVFTGGVNLNGGTVSVASLADASNPSALGASGAISFNGGALEYTGADTTWTRGADLGAAGGSVNIPNNSQNLTLSGQLTGTGGLTKTGNGTLTLANLANTYAGGSSINAGILQLNSAGGAGSSNIVLNGGVLSVGAVKPGNTVEVQSPGIVRGGNAGGLTGISGIIGDSDLTIEVTTGVFDLIGSMVTYSNTITFSNVGGASIRFQGTTGSSLATFDLGTGPMDLMIRNSLQNVNLGALKGASGTTLSGRGGSSNNGPTTHHIGANGQSTTFDGVIQNGSGGGSATTSIVKTGAGTLTLSGLNTYTGSTTISNGVLALKDSGSIDSTTVIDVLAGTALDVSARFDPTFYLGASQTLKGGGTVRGSLQVSGTVSPGASIGTLTVTNVATLAGQAFMELNTTNGLQTNDVLVGQAGVSLGGTLTVTNVGPALVAGQRFVLFSGPITGFFGTVNLPTGEANGTTYTWTDNLATDGSITVATVVSPVNTTPTNIVSSVSGGNLTLSWPADHTGWTLQTQTNTRSVGLNTNWFDVPGSSTTNQVTLPISPAQPTVFFRLFYSIP